jgi:tetratricopeptide (TPR) repeat protein
MKVRPLLLLRYVFTVVLFALIFYCFRADWREGLRSFSVLDLRCFALALPLVVVHYLLKAWKWRVLLHRRGVPAGYGLAMRSLLAGVALSLFTPMNLGELGRVLYLPGRSRSTLAGLVLVDKALDLSAVFLFAVPGAWLLFGPGWAMLPAFAALLAISVLVLGPLSAKVLRRCYRLGPIRARAVRAALAAARVGPGTAVQLLLVALAAFFVVYVLYFVLLRGLLPEASVELGGVMSVVPLVMAGRLVPLTVSGLGVREWIAALLFPAISVTESVAVEVTLLVFLLTSALPALAGVLVRPRRRGLPAVASMLLLLLSCLPPAHAQESSPITFGAGEREGRIPAEYFPRFRSNEQVEQVVEGYRRWLDGERDEALALFEAAAAAEPDNYQPQKLLAHAYMEVGRLADARAALEKALQQFPYDSWIHRLFSRLSYLEGDLESAIESGEEAVRRSKEDVSHVTWLAGLCREAGDAGRELKLYRKAVKMDPHDADLHVSLARLHEERGEPKKAYEEYAEAVRRDPRRCDLIVRLVEFSAELGEPEQVLRAYLIRALRCDGAGRYAARLEPWLHLAPPALLPGAGEAEAEEGDEAGAGSEDATTARGGGA